MRRAYSCRAAAAVFSDDARTQKRADGMLSALECLDAHRNIGPIIAQRLCAVNSRQKQCRAVSAKAVQSGISAGWRFYIYGRVGFLKIRGSAVLRSKMPACSGQAGPSRRRARFCQAECPRAAGKQTLAGGGRGFVKQNARVRRAGGGKLSWPRHAGNPVRRRKACLPRSFGCIRRQSPHGRHSACLGGLAACCAEAVREKAFAFSPGCGFGSRPRPWAAAGKSGREGAAKGCAPPLRAYKKCTRGPCWGRGCRRAEHRRHSAGLYTINCCVLMDSHTTNIVFTMAHT